MNQYVTGAIIKRLREEKNMTQQELAQRLFISDKTISKWETAKGYPDINMLLPLANALEVSVAELLSGNGIKNTNRGFNMLRTKLYVCPICGNVISSIGEAAVSCHGILLPTLEAEEPDENHLLNIERIEDEYYITVNHEMSKEHYISFIAGLSDNGINIIKLYPEGNPETYLKISRTRMIYYFCNKDGLFKIKVK